MTVAKVLERLEHFGNSAMPRVVLGLDGFVDRIARRVAGDGLEQFSEMAQLGRMLEKREERSTSFRLSGVQLRPGGNMPNTAMALSSMGVNCICVGTLGYPQIDELFVPLDRAAEVISYGEPGYCLALEFDTCKMFLSDNGGMEGMDFATLLDRVGEKRLSEALEGAGLLALLNWGEVPEMRGIWRGFAEKLLPALKQKPAFVFLDAADMTNRSCEEIQSLLRTMGLFRRMSFTVLSANDGELNCLAEKAGVGEGRDPKASVREVFGLGCVDRLVHHSRDYAWSLDAQCSADVETRVASHPVLLTGGGDNFNAGYMLGLLVGLDAEGCLMTGNAASSCYVRSGRCARMEDMLEEIRCSEARWTAQTGD